MEQEIQRLFDVIGDARDQAGIAAAFGEPVAAEERTLIPVASSAYGFGLGFGGEEGDDEVPEEGGAGGGAGGFARPIGVIEVSSEGVEVKPIVDEQKVAMAGVMLTGWVVFWIVYALVRIFGKD